MVHTDVDHTGVADLGSPRPRPAWRYPAVALGVVFAVYLVIRGVVELVHIDYTNSASYQHAWGGPHLWGVLAVHTGPGLVVVVATALLMARRLRLSGSGLRVVRRPPRQPNTH
jgi:hypothetical protein